MTPTSPAETTDERTRIRDFWVELFASQEEPFPETWPALTPTEYHKLESLLQERIDRLQEYIQTRQDLSTHQRNAAKLFPETVLRLLRWDWTPNQHNMAWPDVALPDRPEALTSFEQFHCTDDTRKRMAHRIARGFEGIKGRVLFIGDDDLFSLTLDEEFSGELHVLDADKRILDYITSRQPSITCHHRDIVKKGIPSSFYETFDAVVCSPSWSYTPLWDMMSKAILCLKQNRHARIFVLMCPQPISMDGNRMARFFHRIARHGIMCEALWPCFALYSIRQDDRLLYDEWLSPSMLQIESPLLDKLQQVPFLTADLYEFRRLDGIRQHPLSKAIFRWWHCG
jgi:hypothetical protein